MRDHYLAFPQLSFGFEAHNLCAKCSEQICWFDCVGANIWENYFVFKSLGSGSQPQLPPPAIVLHSFICSDFLRFLQLVVWLVWVEIQPGGLKKNFFRFPDKPWSCQYHFYCDFIFNLWKKNQFHDANIKKWVSQI